MSALSMQVTSFKYENSEHFDNDYAPPIGVDNRCSGCISNIMIDFNVPLVEQNQYIKGYRGTTTKVMNIGMIRWECLYKTGERQKFLIPKSYHVTQGGAQLLSPQHWAQSHKDKKYIQGTGITIHAREVRLYWYQRKYELTILFDQSNNISNIFVAPGSSKFKIYYQKSELGPKTD